MIKSRKFTFENELKRLILIHSLGAFIIAPIYAYFIKASDAAEILFYLGISYTLLFPIYALLCWKISYLKDKFIYFFLAHLFFITFFAFQSLLENGFQVLELFCFYSIYTVCSIMIQRWYPLILYNSFVFLLLIYGVSSVKQTEISAEIIAVLFSVYGLSATLVLFSRLSINNHQNEQYEYLEKIFNNSGVGYLLFDIENSKTVLDASEYALTLFNITNNQTEKFFFNLLNEDDIIQIKKLTTGLNYIKDVTINKFNKDHLISIDITPISIRNKNNFLARVTDNTEIRVIKKEHLLIERKYKNLYFKNNAGVFTLDQKSRIVNCNLSFIEIFENTLSKGDKLFLNENENDWGIILESFRDNESAQKFQTQFYLSNGTEKTLLFNWYLDSETDLIEGSIIDLTIVQKTSKALQQSEEKYRLIYEDSNDAILLLDGDKIVDINRKTSQLFGLTQRDLLNTNLYDLSANIKAKTKDEYLAFKGQLLNKRSTKFNWIFKGKSADIEAEVSLIEIMLDKKLYYQCVIKDNTEQNKRLRIIKKNNKNFENILENNPQGILIVKNKKVLYANSEIQKMVGKPFDFDTLFMGKNKMKFEKTFGDHLLLKKRENVQLLLVNAKMKELLVDITIVLTNYENEEASLIIIKDVSAQNILEKEKLRAELAEESNKKLANEIRERIKTERLLEEQFIRTKAILNSSSNTLLLTLSLKEKVSSFNTHCENYFYTVLGKNIKINDSFNVYFEKIISPARLRLFKILFSEVKKGKSRQFEVKLEINGNEHWLEIFMNPIFDIKNNVAELSIVAHDISEKKKTSIEVVNSLREKEILLKEIHHRVKNNLQVISSILNLQSSFVSDENTLEILQESRNRIRSMAIIHENLYRTKDFSSIKFSEYLENLTASLITSYSIENNVSLITKLDEVDLTLDQAIPCGLLVNEIITNALKYAWKPGEKGIITINLKQTKKEVRLEISDNGVGLPANFADLKTETLGLQLVATLVEQLDGEISTEIKRGTKYLVKFENLKL